VQPLRSDLLVIPCRFRIRGCSAASAEALSQPLDAEREVGNGLPGRSPPELALVIRAVDALRARDHRYAPPISGRMQVRRTPRDEG
jgi:hypothetical protein